MGFEVGWWAGGCTQQSRQKSTVESHSNGCLWSAVPTVIILNYFNIKTGAGLFTRTALLAESQQNSQQQLCCERRASHTVGLTCKYFSRHYPFIPISVRKWGEGKRSLCPLTVPPPVKVTQYI